MQLSRALLLIVPIGCLPFGSVTAVGGTIEAASLVSGTSRLLASDESMELRSSAPFYQAGNFFGVTGGINGQALDDANGVAPADELIEINFARDAGLSGLAVTWTRAIVTISGFAANPEGKVGSYNSATGTWSVWCPWTGATVVSYSFSNPAASAGRTLTLTALDPASPNPQVSVVRLISGADGTKADLAITVNPASVGQKIDHFGTSMFWTIDPTSGWPVATKEKLALKFMSEAGGLGLSNLRFDFGGGDIGTGNQSSEPWSWRFPKALKDGATRPYDWTRRGGQQWFLRRARDIGLKNLTLASNSPPWWMTKNLRSYCSSLLSGTSNLASSKADDYARYLVDVMDHFQRVDGISFNRISPVNEPEWAWEDGGQEGNRATADEMRLVVNELHAELTSRGLQNDCKILIGEHAMINPVLDDAYHQQFSGGTWGGGNNANYGKYREYMKDLLSHPDLAGKVDPVVAYHSYFTDDTTTLAGNLRPLLAQNAAARGFGVVQSEFCILGDYGAGRNLQFGPARHVFRVIHKDLTAAGALAWNWWLGLSPHDYKDGLVYTDFNQVGKASPALFDSKIMWALGNFSRFVRPGYQRVDAGGYDQLSGLMTSAWQSPDARTLVLVAANFGSSATVADLAAVATGTTGAVLQWEPWVTDRGRSLRREAAVKSRFTLPADSIVTFVGRMSDSRFRLCADIEAGSGSLSAGESTRLNATATYENGVFRIPAVDPSSAWVFVPTDVEPNGKLQAGRYFIRRQSDGAYLDVLENGGLSATLKLSSLALSSDAWDILPEGEGSVRITHATSGRCLVAGGNGVVAKRVGGGLLQIERIPVVASFLWSDQLGTGATVAFQPIVTQWVQVEAAVGTSRAVGRARIRVGESLPSLTSAADTIFSRPGATIPLQALPRDDARPFRFRLVRSDSDSVITATATSAVAMADPKGNPLEEWECVEPDGSRVWPSLEPGRVCGLRSVSSGLWLMPENGNTAAGSALVLAAGPGSAGRWRIDVSDSGLSRVFHETSGLSLNISGTSGAPILWPDSGSGNMRFFFDPLDDDPLVLRGSHGIGNKVSASVTPQTTTTYTFRATRGGQSVSSTTTVVVQITFEEWALRWFGKSTTPGGDVDGDGASELMEYARGSDPFVAEVADAPITASATGEGMNFGWRKNPEAIGNWQVEGSEDLLNWQAGAGIEVLENSSNFVRVRALPLSGRRFLRLKFSTSP